MSEASGNDRWVKPMFSEYAMKAVVSTMRATRQAFEICAMQAVVTAARINCEGDEGELRGPTMIDSKACPMQVLATVVCRGMGGYAMQAVLTAPRTSCDADNA